ncbi:MAG: Do family serine endopeptidase [Chthoniobacterales bacterium]
MKSKDRSLGWMMAVAGVGILASGTAVFSAVTGNDQKPPLNLKYDNTAINRDTTPGHSFAPIVQKVTPSVVQVYVTTKTGTGNFGMGNQDLQDQLRRFFGRQFPQMPEQQSPGEKALGSGIVISSDGYILTNNHVVQNARTIQVKLTDGRTFSGKVIGTDPETDVALVKIDADNLQPITFADSDQAQVGDVVLAVGDPFGIGQTVTEGIISAKNRQGVSDDSSSDESFIQTDAAINPGNSGGPLIDTDGRLVGMNTAILSRSGGNQGIGFAVPSDLCRWVADSLIKNGKVERGMLGVVIQNLSPELAKAMNSHRTSGALVSEVTPGTPADKAGIKSGDVVTQFDNKPVDDENSLKLMVAETAPGKSVPIQVDRNGQTLNLSVTLESLSAKTTLAKNEPNSNGNEPQGDALHGVGVQDLDRQTREELNIPANVHGALITQVDPSSPSGEAGLREGDVIEEINHQPVRNAEDADRLTEGKGGTGETLVKIWNQNGSHYVAVQEGNG